MQKPLFVKISVSLILTLACCAAVSTRAQSTEQIRPVNFRYSQNPKTKPKPAAPSADSSSQTNQNKTATFGQTSETRGDETISIAKKTFAIAKRRDAAVAPTEIYKVGTGDVLFINLKNAPKDAAYYTVLSDGTIDYPLAGEMITAAGLTTDEIEEFLREKIKLYDNPQVSVGVRDYASHSVSVFGLVEKAGEKRIQREAVPLYVIRAEAVVQPKATQAIVRRPNGATETVNLKDAKSDEVLIFPGDIIEFIFAETGTENKIQQFYYIGGEVAVGGQKDFHTNLSLTQAILASGGLRKPHVKKAIVRRKNFQGLLEAVEYNLKLIKDGKQADPILMPGDTVEVGL